MGKEEPLLKSHFFPFLFLCSQFFWEISECRSEIEMMLTLAQASWTGPCGSLAERLLENPHLPNLGCIEVCFSVLDLCCHVLFANINYVRRLASGLLNRKCVCTFQIA